MARPKSEKTLVSALGEDYLLKIHKLRESLIEVMRLDESTIEETSLRTGINQATLVEFLRGSKFYRSNMLSNVGPRTNKPPRDNIAVKTYQALRIYVLKRRKYLDL